MKQLCKRITIFVMSYVLMISMVFSIPLDAEAKSVKPSVSGSSTMTKGKQAQFSVKYKKKRVSAKSCKWYSTKKSVATVSRSGKVTAKKAGTTYIYVKYKGKKSAKKKVVVKNPVVRPAVSGNSSITRGKNAQFSVKYRGKRVSVKSCKWYSTKKSVATVGKTGRVYGKKAGTTYIYVKYRGKTSAKRKVVVKNPVVRPAVSGSSSITRGKNVQFSVTYNRKRVSAKSCKWYSTKKSVATVGKTGRVYAKKAGTTYIYVKYKGKTSAKKKVIVKNPRCTKESDHRWVREPGETHMYATTVKPAKKYYICNSCALLMEDIDEVMLHCSAGGGSYSLYSYGSEIFRHDIDTTTYYKCSSCGKSKTVKKTDKGKEQLAVFDIETWAGRKFNPEACAFVRCPKCNMEWSPLGWENHNGVCSWCENAYPSWKDNIRRAWDEGFVYRNWDEKGREMIYNPDKKKWEYTGR